MMDELMRLAASNPELYVGVGFFAAFILFLIGALNDRP